MTIDELRSFCLGLPGTHEKETWGDAEHAGDVTFRVKDKIYLITGQEGGSASIRTEASAKKEEGRRRRHQFIRIRRRSFIAKHPLEFVLL